MPHESLENDHRCNANHSRAAVGHFSFRREHFQELGNRGAADYELPFLASRNLLRVRFVAFVRAERWREGRQAPHECRV